MPWLEIPDRQLRMFYVVNTPIAVDSHLADSPPESEPLDPEKPNLVFIHAALSSTAEFSAQFNDARLRQAFNLIAFDARLAGRTEGAPRKTHTLEDSGTCLTAALDQLQLSKYSLVGEGVHGANCCSWIAIKRPERVQAICLVSPGWPREHPDTVEGVCTEWLPAACENKEGKGDGSGTVAEEQLEVLSNYFFGGLGREPERRAIFVEGFQKRYGTGKNSHDITHSINHLRREPIPKELLATIKQPVLILQGGDDTIVSPREGAEEWQKSLTSAKGGADLRVIAGAPHLLCYTDAGVTNRFLLAFVKRNV